MAEEDPLRASVKQYINVCNYVLLEHQEQFALKEIVALADRVFGTDDITFKIVGDDGETLAYYTTRYANGQFAPIREGKDDPDSVFSLPRSHIDDVVANAGDYMAHPGKLDLEWLSVGLKSLII